MALVVEDGTGMATAESYISVAAVTTYLTAHGRETDWTGVADDTTREEHLRNATQYIDQVFRRRFTGDKGSAAQALQWPRKYAEQDGYSLDSDAMPACLLNATAEAALRDVTTTGGILADISSPGNLKSKTIKAGSVTVSKEWVSGSSPLITYRVISGLLGPLLVPPNTVVRG